MMAGTRGRAGFTLLELLVGITIGAGLLLALRQAAVSFANTTTATLDAARVNNRAMIERRRLQRLVADMQSDSNAMSMLEGSTQRAEFDSWCTVPEGWQERCRVGLAVVHSIQHAGLELSSRESWS